MVKSLHSKRYTIFREMLATAREDCGMTQSELAIHLGKPQSFVSKYESGDRRLDFTEFAEIAAVLSVDLAQFIHRYQENVDKGYQFQQKKSSR